MNRRHTDAEREAAIQELQALTPRQREVLTLYAKGLTIMQTARVLDMGPQTVSHHRKQIPVRLRMTRPEAVVLAAKAGIV